MRVARLSEASTARLLDHVATRGRICVLAGSAISIWAPTELPEGGRVTRELAKLIVPKESPRNSLLRRLIMETPFEQVFDKCPREDIARDWVASKFGGGGANPVHLAIARLVACGAISDVITTNYDLALEQALTQSGLNVAPYWDKIGERGVNGGAFDLFKVHGSVEVPQSLTFSLRHEHRMPLPKRTLFHERIADRDLIVCGYSGRDFEICPELLLGRPRTILWNTLRQPSPHNHDLSAYARHVIAKRNGMVLVGDMAKLWSHLSGEEMTLLRADDDKTCAAVVSDLFHRLSSPERWVWRAGVLNAVGCGVAAEICAIEARREATSERQYTAAESELAQARFHLGRYRTAAQDFRRTAELYASLGDRSAEARAMISEADAWRCFGALRDARRVLARVTPCGDERTEGAAELLRAQLLRSSVLVTPVASRRRGYVVEASKSLRKAYQCAVQTGDWGAAQAAELWARRFGIAPAEIAEGTVEVLAPLEGFGHLGFAVAVWMSLLDAVESGDRSRRTLRALRMGLSVARRIGSHPQSWKAAVCLIIAGWGVRQGLPRVALLSFLKCEHRLWFRAAILGRQVIATLQLSPARRRTN